MLSGIRRNRLLISPGLLSIPEIVNRLEGDNSIFLSLFFTDRGVKSILSILSSSDNHFRNILSNKLGGKPDLDMVTKYIKSLRYYHIIPSDTGEIICSTGDLILINIIIKNGSRKTLITRFSRAVDGEYSKLNPLNRHLLKNSILRGVPLPSRLSCKDHMDIRIIWRNPSSLSPDPTNSLPDPILICTGTQNIQSIFNDTTFPADTYLRILRNISNGYIDIPGNIPRSGDERSRITVKSVLTYLYSSNKSMLLRRLLMLISMWTIISGYGYGLEIRVPILL